MHHVCCARGQKVPLYKGCHTARVQTHLCCWGSRWSGLPVAQPRLDDKQRKKSQQQEPLDAATLLRQLREHGFVLEVLLPACLHPSKTVLPAVQILQIGDEQVGGRRLKYCLTCLWGDAAMGPF